MSTDYTDQDDNWMNEEEEQSMILPSEEIPHYMLPNFSSLLPEYANAEVDQIRGAFTTNNFTSLHKIPTKLGPNAVNQARFEHMDENRLAPHDIKPTPKLLTKNGLFHQFEYTSSRFSLVDELAQMERLQSEAKRMNISGKDFITTGEQKKLKSEDAFGNIHFRYPHLSQPYPDTKDSQRHERWLESKKILHGPFIPSGHRLSNDTMTKLCLPELIQEIHEILQRDWEGLEWTIAPTIDENLAIRFKEETIESEHGLIAYMNIFIQSHRIASKYKLQKVAEDWNTKPGDGGLYFVIRPPWTKNRSREMIVLIKK